MIVTIIVMIVQVSKGSSSDTSISIGSSDGASCGSLISLSPSKSAAKRRKLGIKYSHVVTGFLEDENHPAMAACDFEQFDQAIIEAVGPEQDDGPYILERHACARVFNLPASKAQELVPKIGRLAQKHGLTSAQG